MPAVPLAPDDAIEALVDLSRRVADAAEPERIPGLLARAVERHLAPAVVAVWLTGTDGAPVLAECIGLPRERLAQLEPGHGMDLPVVRALPLASGGDLFGTLAIGWDQDPGPAADRLAAGLADIAATGLDRAHRTRELVDAVRALEESRRELARTESLRHLGQMAAVVAHEVKNPLASIGGVLQVFRDRSSERPEREILGKVLDRLTELDRLVDELLRFARPRAPALAPVPLGAFLHDVAAQFRQDPASRSVQVRVRVERDVAVPIDAPILQRVLLNLLINAAQAMDGEGEVELACEPGPSRVLVAVSDRGPGIPIEQREQVFEPFFTTKVRGSGLGLAIARQAIEAHGGSIAVEDAPGGGARFLVTLPSS